MRKEYKVTCEVNLCADRKETVYVTTNLPAKALKLAKEKLENRGYFAVSVISCKEV